MILVIYICYGVVKGAMIREAVLWRGVPRFFFLPPLSTSSLTARYPLHVDERPISLHHTISFSPFLFFRSRFDRCGIFFANARTQVVRRMLFFLEITNGKKGVCACEVLMTISNFFFFIFQKRFSFPLSSFSLFPPSRSRTHPVVVSASKAISPLFFPCFIFGIIPKK